MVKISGEAKRVRIYIGENSRYKSVSLYHAIVLKAKELGLAGATVCRGVEGYGANSRIKTSKLLDLSNDLPVIVEIVDSAEYIAKLLPFLDDCVKEGMITVEDVEVIKYTVK